MADCDSCNIKSAAVSNLWLYVWVQSVGAFCGGTMRLNSHRGRDRWAYISQLIPHVPLDIVQCPLRNDWFIYLFIVTSLVSSVVWINREEYRPMTLNSTVKCRCSSENCRWMLWKIASLTWLHLHGTGHIIGLVILCVVEVEPSARAFYGVGLRPLACWDCGFESRWGHGFLSVVSVVCC
jgi:hypothetical protein